MTEVGSQELGLSLGFRPVSGGEITDIEVHGLGQEWTSGNSSVAACKTFVLLMTFIMDAGMSSIKFFTCCIFNVSDCRVYQQLEVPDAGRSCVEVVEGGDVVVVTDIWLEGVQELFCIYERQGWYGFTRLGKLNN